MQERSGEIESVGASFDKLMDELVASQRERELLTNELRHRVKNTLTTVQAIASQTARPGSRSFPRADQGACSIA